VIVAGLHAAAAREEATLSDEAEGALWSGCRRDLDELPLPDGPAYVGVDGGFVRDRAGSWFEVVAGKSIPGFRRTAPDGEEPRPAKCFAFVQAHDDRARRRLLDVLAGQGYAPNQRVVLMSDGGESVRRLVSCIGPEAEHVLDWFHVTMRLTELVQMTKGACPDPGWTERRLADLERLKWLLWHGHARHALEAAEGFAEDAWCMEEEASGEAKTKPARLRVAAEEFAVYLRRNTGQLVDYGERHRAGERISTGFVESAINQIVAKRFSKRQSMRWTKCGAHLALQTRTRVLNGWFDPVPPRLARNTIIESTFDVGRRFRCTMRVDCGQLDPGAVIQPIRGEWQPRMPEQLDEEELADWRAGRNAIYQLAALTVGARLAVADG
jgi:hypothetical protein